MTKVEMSEILTVPPYQIRLLLKSRDLEGEGDKRE
jgi:hypothetical protein